MLSSGRLNFSDLSELHKCANNLLQDLDLDHNNHHDQTMSKISDASLKMLDLCGSTRDTLLLFKDHFQDLQLAFRRARIQEGSYFNGPTGKKVKKGISKCMKDIKGLTKTKYFGPHLPIIDHSLIVVVHVLREVRGAMVSILESLTSLFKLPDIVISCTNVAHSQRSGLVLMNKLVCRGMVMERCDSMEVRMANKRLEEVESTIEDLEAELESIIRRLMRTRVLLLNILTN